VAQVVECLSSKHEVRECKPQYQKKKKIPKTKKVVRVGVGKTGKAGAIARLTSFFKDFELLSEWTIALEGFN
jgi:hypothetical protein